MYIHTLSGRVGRHHSIEQMAAAQLETIAHSENGKFAYACTKCMYVCMD